MKENTTQVDSHSIFDTSQARIGAIEPDGEGVAAFGVDGRKLGTFATSLEAVSVIMRHARMPAADRDADAELIIERFMKGHSA